MERSGSKTALLKRKKGQWVEISWNSYYESVRFISQGLRSIGVERGDRVALFSNTRVEWVYCDLAILGCGAATAPIYPSSRAQDIEHIVENSDASIIIVENALLLDKILEIRDELASIRKIILIEGPNPDDDNKDVLTLAQVVELGRQMPAGLYEEMAGESALNDIATIVYTMSSSGPQRGVVLANAQILAEQAAVHKVMPLGENEITLLFLPLAHIFGRVLEFMNIHSGIKMAFSESYDRLMDNLVEVRPHMIAAVPRVFEKIYSEVLKEVEIRGVAQRELSRWCLEVGQEVSDRIQRSRHIPMSLKTKYKVAKKLFFDRFSQRFGSRVKYLVSSGAPLQKEIGKFFHATGLGILEAYGMTELAGAVTMNSKENFKIGSVGKPLSSFEIKLAEDGEILVKGPTVMNEYQKDSEATKDVLRDGWLHTGDIGENDEDGFLRITGRKKDIIITSGGKNISPQNIEKHMRSDPFINQIYTHGDQRNFLSALVTLNRDSIIHWAKGKGIVYRNFEEFVQSDAVKRLIEERIQIKNKDLAGPETIKKFHIVPHDFSQETGELTGSNKLRREFVYQKYRDILDDFYR